MLQTRPAFIDGQEVLEVTYDAKEISLDNLTAAAEGKDLAAALPADHALRYDQQLKYYLQSTPLRFLPMTELQASRVNATIKENWMQFLSPRQLELLKFIKQNPDAKWAPSLGVDFKIAWDRAMCQVVNQTPR